MQRDPSTDADVVPARRLGDPGGIALRKRERACLAGGDGGDGGL
jgi:hypothetical protein